MDYQRNSNIYVSPFSVSDNATRLDGNTCGKGKKYIVDLAKITSQQRSQKSIIIFPVVIPDKRIHALNGPSFRAADLTLPLIEFHTYTGVG